MRNFPINILAMAQSAIGTQQYVIEEWSYAEESERGHLIDFYLDPVVRRASIQPMEPKAVNFSGLDMNQVYIEIFDLDLIKILTRTENPPRISFGGYYWHPIPNNQDWMAQGGWNHVTCSRGRKK